MLEHFKASSNPLDKWLVARQWGLEYLRKQRIDFDAYNRNFCELKPRSDYAATTMVLNYCMPNRRLMLRKSRARRRSKQWK
jgi:hypothetical protein